METLRFSQIKDYLPEHISKYYSPKELSRFMCDNCEICVETGSFVNQGDIIYRVTRKVNNEVSLSIFSALYNRALSRKQNRIQTTILLVF